MYINCCWVNTQAGGLYGHFVCLLVVVEVWGDMCFVKGMFLGFCWIQTSDAISDLWRCLGINVAVVVGHVVKIFFLPRRSRLIWRENTHPVKKVDYLVLLITCKRYLLGEEVLAGDFCGWGKFKFPETVM